MRRYGAYVNEKMLGRLGLRIVRRSSLDALAGQRAETTQLVNSIAPELHDLKARLAALAAQNDALAAGLDQRVAAVLLPHFDALAQRLAAAEARPLAPDLAHRLDALEQAIAGLDAKLARLEPPAPPQPPPAPEPLPAPAPPEAVSEAAQREMLALVAHFRPVAAKGHGKLRLGNAHDGGYVLLDDLARAHVAYSLGVGGDSSWDLALADRGIRIHQFDHTDLAVPPEHANIVFHKLRIAPAPGPGAATLAGLHQAGESDGADRARAILKIDIEGDEWPVLAAAAPADLAPFAQIICEFHDLHRAADDAWRFRALAVMAKLSRQFAVVHVHGNNYRPFATVANVPFPQVVEVTLASRAVYEFEPSAEAYPTPLDRPNDPTRPDMILGTLQLTQAV